MRIFILDYPGHPFAVELSRELARRGHEVRHAYFAADGGPKGLLDPEPGDPSTFSVEPVSIRAAYSKSNLLRRHILDGAFGAVAARALEAFRPEVVLIGQAPLNALPPLRAAARRVNSKFVLWLQDVFGLAAAALLKNKWGGVGQLVAGRYKSVEQQVLCHSDHVIAITSGFLPYLERCGVASANASVIPNWGPLSMVPVRPKDNPWSRRHGLNGKLVFSYSGTLGLKHNPQLLYDLASSFEARDDVIVQVTCTGVGGEWLKQRSHAAPLHTLRVMPLAPIAELPDLYGAADVLVAVLEADAGAFSAPSKVLAYLCAGRAVLLSAPSQNASAKALEAAGAGLLTKPSDVSGFIEAAHRLVGDATGRATFGESARRYAEQAFDIGTVSDPFEALLLAQLRGEAMNVRLGLAENQDR